VPHNSPRARGAVAELERSLIVERMKAGLRNRRAKGKHLGRTKRVVDARRIDELRVQGAGSPVNEWLIIFKTRRSQPAGTFLRSSIKREVKKKNVRGGWNLSCFAAHLNEQDLF